MSLNSDSLRRTRRGSPVETTRFPKPLPPLLLLLGSLIITACAEPPLGLPLKDSFAKPPSLSTAAGAIAETWFERSDGTSGFTPLADGQEALGARLRLIDQAERTLDLQYFLMKPDLASALLSDTLVRAANRGVRVRLLLDDIFTTMSDEDLAALDARPNLEVRLFNPVARPGPKWLGFLANFERTNRRMHNKVFIADSAVAILGGRNIADEYFALKQEVEIAHLDLLGAGPVAVEAARSFDQYWNSALSVPLAALVPTADRPAMADTGNDVVRARRIYREAVESRFLERLEDGDIELIGAPGVFVNDPVAKLLRPRNSGLGHVYDQLATRIAAASEEVILLSPYFIPRPEDVALLKAVSERGVNVVVITNSLASTNHPLAHGGYAPLRRELLAAGVRIFEGVADAPVSWITGDRSRLVLHAKAAVIDREIVFVGSLNVDARSIEINSENGVFVRSERLARRLARAIEAGLSCCAYALELDEEGRLVWREVGALEDRLRRDEPEGSVWRDFVAFMGTLLPIRNQL